MTQYMQSLKTSGEMKKQLQEEITQLTDKLNKVLGSQGLKANIRRSKLFIHSHLYEEDDWDCILAKVFATFLGFEPGLIRSKCRLVNT